jgi:hypothetical protein
MAIKDMIFATVEEKTTALIAQTGRILIGHGIGPELRRYRILLRAPTATDEIGGKCRVSERW